MPIYEYACTSSDCTAHVEVYVSSQLSYADVLTCERCGAPMLKLMSAAWVPPSGTYSYGDKRSQMN